MRRIIVWLRTPIVSQILIDNKHPMAFLDVPQRWGTIFAMTKRFADLQPFITTQIFDVDMNLMPEEWAEVRQ